jgi:hypothetical protein
MLDIKRSKGKQFGIGLSGAAMIAAAAGLLVLNPHRHQRKDVSALVGASREKVNKQLRRWEGDDVLGKDDGRIVIMNAAALPSAQ